MPDHSDYLTYQELATLLHLPKGTLYSLVSRQRIPFLRLGKRLVRFRRKDIEVWIEEKTYEGGGHE